MGQPACYIRIITEKLTTHELTVSAQVLSQVQYVAVGLPLLHLAQSPLQQPDKGIEPQEATGQLGHKQFGRMAEAGGARHAGTHRPSARTRSKRSPALST